jgi:uncharacterized membrane protein
MISPWFFVLLSPFLWGFMNVVDKYMIAHRVKTPLSYAMIVAGINILYAGIIGLFLHWSGYGWKDLIWPIFPGILLGAQVFFYYTLLEKEDVSHIIGILYVYPIIVAFLSFLFLGEVLSLLGYLGVIIALSGAIMLNMRAKKINWKVGIWTMLVFICIVALDEFLVKVATNHLPAMNGFVINNVALGFTVLLGLFHPAIRQGLIYELRNIPLALLTELTTVASNIVMYLAMEGLPVAIVSSVGSLQPLAALIFESIANRLFGKMTRDTNFVQKLIPICIIIVGIVLIYISQA